MNSEGVKNRLVSAGHVITAAETHAPGVGARLDDQLAPHYGEGPPPTHTRQILALARKLGADVEVMTAADAAHEAELADDPPHRRDRDARAARLRADIVQFRELVRAGYGPEGERALRISDRTPEQPQEVADMAETIAANQAQLANVAPRDALFRYDFAARVAGWPEEARALRHAVKKVAVEAQEATDTMAKRDAAIVAYDNSFSRIAGTLFALFRQAGEDALAARVRPAKRRRGVTAVDAGETDAPEEEN